MQPDRKAHRRAAPERAGGHARPRLKLPSRPWLVAIVGGLLAVIAGSVVIFLGPDDSQNTAAPGAETSPSAPADSLAPSATVGSSPTPATPSPTSTSNTAGAGGPSACAAFPAFPDAQCTGWRHTGVTLHPCDNVIAQSGITLDSCLFDDTLSIEGANVTITRSRVEGRITGVYTYGFSLRNLLLRDVEIDGSAHGIDPASQAAIGSEDYTCIRCDIHHTGRGANLGENVHIEDSYLHDWTYVDGAHQTAIGSNGGHNFTIVHNNLECRSGGCSAALSLYGDFAPIDNVTIERNLFNTSGSYCTYAGSVDGKPYPDGTNIRYRNNMFGKKYMPKCGIYGAVVSWESNAGNVWTGNAWQDGSGSVTP